MSFMLAKSSQIARSPGDPQVLETGPSSRSAVDNAGKALGWFSLALGTTELLAAPALARWLGVEGRENVIRAMGVREIASGMLCLSTETPQGVWSRVAGDLIDIAALSSAYNDDNPRRGNVGMALAAVLGATLADLATAQGLTARHGRNRGEAREYRDRSGWPKGVEHSRGAAAGFRAPAGLLAAGTADRGAETAIPA